MNEAKVISVNSRLVLQEPFAPIIVERIQKMEMLDRRQKILLLAKAIQAIFSTSDWTEIGYITGTDEWIDRHPRLLRSLKWEDGDYKGCVFEAIAHIIDSNSVNLRHLVDYEPINTWLKENEPEQFKQLHSEVSEKDVAEVVPQTSTDAGFAALADAQVLLRSR